ncbi:MAG TPA: branched-chain amino acid ABC transporter permease [Desulfobacteraceae bacterium]|nr:branched-chain amino acid ABC transporter permease [Desulfobacteraceae bacterium]HPJ66818.1 branched-chain amino acid ABC transporter permease [Desulfobacteraceae bacterium]HPQ27028.1 branched-chain amino acid ABC transporter permease [Desulfobacteraceae bacterium]
MGFYMIMQGFQNSMVLSGIYILGALGISLVLGVLHIVNFAHGSILMIGGFLAYTASVLLGINYILAILIAVILTALMGALTQRYLYGQFFPEVLPVVLVAVGLTEILQQGAIVIWGAAPVSVPSIVSGSFRLGGAYMSNERLLVVGISVLLIIGLFLFLYKTNYGRALRAIAQDQDGAILMGVNIKKVSILGMAIACGLAGAAGSLVAPVFNVSSSMGVGYLMKAFAIAIMGGLGNLPGTVLAGIVIGLVEGYGFMFIGQLSTLIVFALVLLILIIKPTGLLPGTLFE